MKRAIRQWMGGHDFHDPADPICVSHKGVLSFRGVPVGLCYYSYVTGKRHQIISDTADEKVRRYFKNREVVEHNNIMSLISMVNNNPRALSPVGTDALVLRHIKTVNTTMGVIGAVRPFRSGEEFIRADRKMDWEKNPEQDVQDELTLLLYKLQREGAQPIPYLVKAQHDTDRATMKGQTYWRELGASWFGTRDLTEFTLFKIGRIKSLPFEISYSA